MNSTDNIDVFDDLTEETTLTFTAKSTNNDLFNDDFVTDYTTFSNDYQCQCDHTSAFDSSLYDLKIDFSRNYRNLSELVIMINLTVPTDLPVTKAQQGHIYCFDSTNGLGFIVGNTFPVVDDDWQSDWVKNQYIFLKDDDFDPDNYDLREDTFYRFGLSKENGVEEIWY